MNHFFGCGIRVRLAVACALLCGAFVPSAGAQQTNAPALAILRDEADQVLERAVAFLLSQQKENGSISEGGHANAITALAIMAIASVGTTASEDSPRGHAMRRALDSVLHPGQVTEAGYYGERDGSRMYGHGIIALMLSEMIGMGADDDQDQRIRERCEAAIQVILQAQKRSKQPASRGGWRYTPDAGDSDLSVSVWQVMALRSAKMEGLDVPDEAIQQAVGYLHRSCTSPLDARLHPIEPVAGFAYVPGDRNPQYAMTAAGLLAMQVCGQYDSPLTDRAAKWLRDHPPKWQDRFFFYGTYYYSQGMHQRGGEDASVAAAAVREILLKEQQADGSWQGHGEEHGHGKLYATAMATLSLSVKYHYLPIYQR